MLESINQEQRLYWLKHDEGYTSLGFDHAQYIIQSVANWLGIKIQHTTIGTKEHYKQYEQVLILAQNHFNNTGERCKALLNPQFIGLEGKLVEVIDQEGDKPRKFRVGRSTGWMPIHLEITKSNTGGPPALKNYFKVTRK